MAVKVFFSLFIASRYYIVKTYSFYDCPFQSDQLQIHLAYLHWEGVVGSCRWEKETLSPLSL